MTFDEWWKKETDDNENNVDDWKGFCKTAFEAGQKEIKQLGERCNQLLKDKGSLTDRIDDIKANCDLAIEGRDVKIKELEKQAKDLEWQLQEVVKDNNNYQAENKRLEQQVEKMKCCKICAYGGNDFGVCYSNKPCKNKNKWKLAKWVNGR